MDWCLYVLLYACIQGCSYRCMYWCMHIGRCIYSCITHIIIMYYYIHHYVYMSECVRVCVHTGVYASVQCGHIMDGWMDREITSDWEWLRVRQRCEVRWSWCLITRNKSCVTSPLCLEKHRLGKQFLFHHNQSFGLIKRPRSQKPTSRHWTGLRSRLET